MLLLELYEIYSMGVEIMSIRDKIFKSNNLDYTAHYGWQKSLGDESYTFGYINSYKEAGDVLVEEKRPDLMMFPIMFSYRQYLELLLKNICQKGMDDIGYNELIKKSSHDLDKIWKPCKNLLQDIISAEEVDFIEEVVDIFFEIDPNSFTFRFEKDRKQKSRTIKEDYLTINTKVVKDWIGEVDGILRHTYDSV